MKLPLLPPKAPRSPEEIGALVDKLARMIVGRRLETPVTIFLESHRPLDAVIVMLGTNDLKHRFALSANDIAQGAGQLVDIVFQSKAGRDGIPPRVLLLAPPPVGRLLKFADMFKSAEGKSNELGKYYKLIADEKACLFLDTSAVIKSSNLDGIHLEKQEHAKLGKNIAEFVRNHHISFLPDI